jgi:hypothetical protein
LPTIPRPTGLARPALWHPCGECGSIAPANDTPYALWHPCGPVCSPRPTEAHPRTCCHVPNQGGGALARSQGLSCGVYRTPFAAVCTVPYPPWVRRRTSLAMLSGVLQPAWCASHPPLLTVDTPLTHNGTLARDAGMLAGARALPRRGALRRPRAVARTGRHTQTHESQSGGGRRLLAGCTSTLSSRSRRRTAGLAVAADGLLN